MYTNEAPEKYEHGPESGPGGSVWAQTLSKRRPEAQDHFPSPPGPKSPIQKIKKAENAENRNFYLSEQSEVKY